MSCQEKYKVLVKEIFAQRLRQFMKESGFKNARMAEILGVSLVSVSRYLNGHQLMDTAQLIRLANGTNINLAWLLTGKKSVSFAVDNIPRPFCTFVNNLAEIPRDIRTENYISVPLKVGFE